MEQRELQGKPPCQRGLGLAFLLYCDVKGGIPMRIFRERILILLVMVMLFICAPIKAFGEDELKNETINLPSEEIVLEEEPIITEEPTVIEQLQEVVEEEILEEEIQEKKEESIQSTHNLLSVPITNEEENTVEITTEDDLKNVVNEVNTNKNTKTVKLKNDISVSNKQRIELSGGELTILGENNSLTACISVLKDAVLNLGKTGYTETLKLISNRNDSGIIDVTDTATVNIYEGVTIGPCTVVGMPGGISAHKESTVNMYGGTITDCVSYAVAGGIYLDGLSTFNMYDGTIQNCIGVQGGAVGLSGGSPFGHPDASAVTFNMYGGEINNCVDQYVGGGAVCAYTRYPVSFNMYNGIIHDCSATSYGYGGAILIYSTDAATKVNLMSGTIINNSANYGGGIFIFQGDTFIANGFGLYNNSAKYAGDDIYNNGANVTLGTACTDAKLNVCNHLIDGWYEDASTRWNFNECTGEENHIKLFTNTEEVCNNEYGLKAAHGDNPKEDVNPEPIPEIQPTIPEVQITESKPAARETTSVHCAGPNTGDELYLGTFTLFGCSLTMLIIMLIKKHNLKK